MSRKAPPYLGDLTSGVKGAPWKCCADLRTRGLRLVSRRWVALPQRTRRPIRARRHGGPVQAITIRQPWAWAIIFGGKDIETGLGTRTTAAHSSFTLALP